MNKQLRGLFCAAALAAMLALPALAAEQTHRAYLCGYPDGSIRPNAPVTRAQLACTLVRLAEEPLPEPECVTFFDVPSSHWACAQIGKLTGLGLLPFGDGGWFLPSAAVSWRELCSVLDTLAGSETGREAFPAPMSVQPPPAESHSILCLFEPVGACRNHSIPVDLYLSA